MLNSFTTAFAAQRPQTFSGASGSFAMAPQAVTIVAGLLTLDYSLGQQVEILLNQNVTTVNLTAIPTAGAVMELIMTQDATGSRTVAWPSTWLAAGGFRPELPPYPNSVSRILISTAAGRVFFDFAGLDYR